MDLETILILIHSICDKSALSPRHHTYITSLKIKIRCSRMSCPYVISIVDMLQEYYTCTYKFEWWLAYESFLAYCFNADLVYVFRARSRKFLCLFVTNGLSLAFIFLPIRIRLSANDKSPSPPAVPLHVSSDSSFADSVILKSLWWNQILNDFISAEQPWLMRLVDVYVT